MFCSLFEMENYQGDLTDIVHGGGSATTGAYSYTCATGLSSDYSLDSTSCDHHLWPQLPSSDDHMNFGDPFSTSQDPFLHHMSDSISTFNFVTSNSQQMIPGSLGFRGGGDGGGDAVSQRPCNIFSRMLEISPSSKFGSGVTTPCDSAAAVGNSPSSTSIKASISAAVAAPSSDIMINNGSNSKPLCLIDNSGIQISSPRNPAIKRRKSQVKKVVCIPAPAPANSRPSSGEVVPSDLWAWRKYGQKPIKGSPYPRGYYRCSSSKGCSARKQVERSRTDPNMLVITYTSDHNHPWPTQRNALAGSTRGQPSRSSSSMNKTGTPSSSAQKITSLKDDQNYDNTSSNDGELTMASPSPSPLVAAANCGAAKELEDQIEMEDGDHQEFPYNELTLPASNDCASDFFSDFGEMSDYLLFSQNLLTGKDDGRKDDRIKAGGSGVDPFSHVIYGWPENNNDTNSSSS